METAIDSVKPSPLRLHLAALLVGMVAFAAVWAVLKALFDAEFDANSLSDYRVALSVSVLSFWLAAYLQGSGVRRAFWLDAFEEIALSAGINLISQALLAYLRIAEPLPLVVSAGGAMLGAVVLGVVRDRWISRDDAGRGGLLLLGCDPVALAVVEELREPVVGVAGGPSAGAYPRLEAGSGLDAAIEQRRPALVLLSGDWASIASPELLWKLHIGGIPVEDASAAYERLFAKVSIARLAPADFVFSSDFSANRQALAVQAIYSNLVGLAALLISAPLLIATAAILFLTEGRGRIIERTECVGFQGIPFQQLRFRTHRRGQSQPTPTGRWLLRLRLDSLPQIVNIVRGEMSLFGPEPVRVEFAERLRGLIPYYFHRFSVRPGVLGWAQVHTQRGDAPPDETDLLEYDFYYLKNASISLDAAILTRWFLGLWGRRGARPAMA